MGQCCASKSSKRTKKSKLKSPSGDLNQEADEYHTNKPLYQIPEDPNVNIIGSKPKKNSKLINRLSFRHKKDKNKQPEPVIKTTTTTYTIQTTTTITIQEASDDEDGSINEHKLDDTQVDVDAFEQNESQNETNNDTITNSNVEDKAQDFTNSSNAKEVKRVSETTKIKEKPESTWKSYSDLFESMDSVFNSMTMLTKDSLDKTLLELDSTFLDANEDTIEKLKSNTFETFGEYDEDYEFYEYDLASLSESNEPDQLYKELLDAELNSGENFDKLYADVDGLNKKQCKINNTHENIHSDSDSRHFKIDNYYLSQSLKEIKENFDFKNQYSHNINKQFNSADLFLYKNFNSYLCLNNSIEYLFSPFITNADSIYEIARIIANNSRNSNKKSILSKKHSSNLNSEGGFLYEANGFSYNFNSESSNLSFYLNSSDENEHKRASPYSRINSNFVTKSESNLYEEYRYARNCFNSVNLSKSI
jgi:hypothetical protein